jgi:hypothetical protein
MTQYKLKLLTILVNLLATHLAIIDRDQTFDFVTKLIDLMKQSDSKSQESVEASYQNIKAKIPKKHLPKHFHLVDKQLQPFLLPFGFNLLLELTYLFIVQCKSEVVPLWLRDVILQEFRNILQSLVTAQMLFERNIKVDSNGNFESIS